MKKLTYVLLLLTFFAQGQILNPVKWKTKVVQKSETEFEKHQKQFFDEGYSSTKWRTMKIVIATVCQ